VNSTPRITPGFLISMTGLSEIPFGLVFWFLLDKYSPMEIVGGITLGLWIFGMMSIFGIGLFFYGRWLGWKPKVSVSDPVQRQ
jgi:hypothetical protein